MECERNLADLLSQKVKAAPGRVAVLWAKENEKVLPSGLLVTLGANSNKELLSRRTGMRWAEVVSSGVYDIGDWNRVSVIENSSCVIWDQRDIPEIPDGYEIRFYGLYEPWDKAILGIDEDTD